MSIDERMLKSVIEEVLKEMAGGASEECNSKKEEIPKEVSSLVVTEIEKWRFRNK